MSNLRFYYTARAADSLFHLEKLLWNRAYSPRLPATILIARSQASPSLPNPSEMAW